MVVDAQSLEGVEVRRLLLSVQVVLEEEVAGRLGLNTGQALCLDEGRHDILNPLDSYCRADGRPMLSSAKAQQDRQDMRPRSFLIFEFLVLTCP